MKAKDRMVVARGWREGEGGGANQQVLNFSYARWVGSRDSL